jgi:hypothetical protein
MNEQRIPNQPSRDLRIDFAAMDDATWLRIDEVAALMAVTLGAAQMMKKRGRLPAPAVVRGKCIRWTVGQMREWLRAPTLVR